MVVAVKVKLFDRHENGRSTVKLTGHFCFMWKISGEVQLPLQVHGVGNTFGFLHGDQPFFAQLNQVLIH